MASALCSDAPDCDDPPPAQAYRCPPTSKVAGAPDPAPGGCQPCLRAPASPVIGPFRSKSWRPRRQTCGGDDQSSLRGGTAEHTLPKPGRHIPESYRSRPRARLLAGPGLQDFLPSGCIHNFLSPRRDCMKAGRGPSKVSARTRPNREVGTGGTSGRGDGGARKVLETTRTGTCCECACEITFLGRTERGG